MYKQQVKCLLVLLQMLKGIHFEEQGPVHKTRLISISDALIQLNDGVTHLINTLFVFVELLMTYTFMSFWCKIPTSRMKNIMEFVFAK